MSAGPMLNDLFLFALCKAKKYECLHAKEKHKDLTTA